LIKRTAQKKPVMYLVIIRVSIELQPSVFTLKMKTVYLMLDCNSTVTWLNAS
jgi:hypothetical protein